LINYQQEKGKDRKRKRERERERGEENGQKNLFVKSPVIKEPIVTAYADKESITNLIWAFIYGESSVEQ